VPRARAHAGALRHPPLQILVLGHREEQRRALQAREETDPLKQWKLSPIDMASLDKWDDYTEAKEAMFFYTDTADAPWT
jgi:polyphosphate kinase 2 (PPK2 family)